MEVEAEVEVHVAVATSSQASSGWPAARVGVLLRQLVAMDPARRWSWEAGEMMLQGMMREQALQQEQTVQQLQDRIAMLEQQVQQLLERVGDLELSYRLEDQHSRLHLQP